MRSNLARFLFASPILPVLLTACGGDSPGPDAGDPGIVDAGPPDGGPIPDDSPYKGPWAHRVTTTSIVVRWESQLRPASVEVEVTPEGGGTTETLTGSSRETVTLAEYSGDPRLIPEPDLPGTYFVNDTEIAGLEPARCYTYSLVGWPGHEGRFCTLHEPDDHTTPISFYVIGDTSPAVMGTLRVLSSADPIDTEFTVHVGDIQYYSSVIETHQLWFRLMEPLIRANAFLPCVGNHEVDEIEHEYADFYARLFAPAGVDGTNEWYHYQTGGVHFFSLSTEHELGLGTEQIDWLETEIAEAEADANYRFSILYLHKPLYSLGDYRINDAHRASLLPIIGANRIPLVLAGHTHAYERFEIDGVTHITSGAGGFVDRAIDQQVAERPEEAAMRVASGLYLQAMFVEIVRDAGTGRDVIRGRVVDDMGIERDSFEHEVLP